MWLIMFLFLKYIVVCEFVWVVSRWSSFLSLSLSCILFLCCIHHALSFCSVWWYFFPVKVLWALKICKLSTLEYFQVLFDVIMYFFRGKKDRMDDLMVELTLDADVNRTGDIWHICVEVVLLWGFWKDNLYFWCYWL